MRDNEISHLFYYMYYFVFCLSKIFQLFKSIYIKENLEKNYKSRQSVVRGLKGQGSFDRL